MRVQEKIKQYEKAAVDSYKTAMKRRGVSLNLCVSEASQCAEKLCNAMYIRNTKEIKDISFGPLINKLNKLNLIDYQIKVYLDSIRVPANKRRHDTPDFMKHFVDIVRLQLIEVVRWYHRKAKTRLKVRLNFDHQKLQKRPASVHQEMLAKKVVTMDQMEDNIRILGDHYIEKKRTDDSPVFLSLLIDKSLSMTDDKADVIEAHRTCVNAFRQSEDCASGRLFVMQHLFNHESELINSLTRLESNSSDNVVLLDNNYEPSGGTALYDAVYDALLRLSMEARMAKKENGLPAEIIIGIFTDGEDLYSNRSPSEVKVLVENLKNEGVIRTTVVVGWISEYLTEQKMKELQESIGFHDTIAVKHGSDKAIRRAFNIFSDYALKQNSYEN